MSTNHTLAHIAIIMDGNGRWAKGKKLPAIAGYKAGADAASRVIEYAVKRHIPYLTLFAFSYENWQRESMWLKEFMDLLQRYLLKQSPQFVAKGIRVRFIGNMTLLAPNIVKHMRDLEENTKNNTLIQVNVALSYSGRDDIVRGVRTMMEKVIMGELSIDEITQDRLASFLDTHGLPDPDLLIRTSGEERLSNFMLWQLAYSEFLFLPILWPDFAEEDFDQAINTYKKRSRRYGA